MLRMRIEFTPMIMLKKATAESVMMTTQPMTSSLVLATTWPVVFLMINRGVMSAQEMLSPAGLQHQDDTERRGPPWFRGGGQRAGS